MCCSETVLFKSIRKIEIHLVNVLTFLKFALWKFHHTEIRAIQGLPVCKSFEKMQNLMEFLLLTFLNEYLTKNHFHCLWNSKYHSPLILKL